MTMTACPGLDGSNPLHFLASLGALRLLPDGSTLSWRYEGAWRPLFRHEEAAIHERLSRGLRRGLADHAPVAATTSKNGAPQKAEPDGADRGAVAEAYGFLGFAPIPRAPAAVFRAAAARTLEGEAAELLEPAHPARFLAALNAESPTGDEGILDPTAFSFSNDCGGQVLHKDFLTLASFVTPEAIAASFEGRPERHLWCTSLNWDPRSLRSYAHQWENPESQPKETDVAANALAFVGLLSYPVVPQQRGSRTLGMVPARKVYRWPLWEGELSLPVVESLVALAPEEQDARRGRGVAAVYEAERFSSNKRLFFAPAVSV